MVFTMPPLTDFTRPMQELHKAITIQAPLRIQTGMTGDGYYVRANIEGLRPGDIQVYLRRNRLVLQVEQSDRYGLRDPGARSTSQWQMRVRKQLRLPYDADVTGMTTSTDNGIMEIFIPRRSQYLPVDPLLVR